MKSTSKMQSQLSAISLAEKLGNKISICIEMSSKKLPLSQVCIQHLWEERIDHLIIMLREHGAYVYSVNIDEGECPIESAPPGLPVVLVRMCGPSIDDLIIRPMDISSQLDIDYYTKLVGASMRDEDFLTAAELRTGLHGRPLISWFAELYGQIVGWSCIGIPSRYIAEPDSVHLMGVVTDPAFRGFGIARALTEHGLALCGTRPLSVSIQPGNIESENLMRSFGFEHLDSHHVWQTWYRNATPLSRIST